MEAVRITDARTEESHSTTATHLIYCEKFIMVELGEKSAALMLCRGTRGTSARMPSALISKVEDEFDEEEEELEEREELLRMILDMSARSLKLVMRNFTTLEITADWSFAKALSVIVRCEAAAKWERWAMEMLERQEM